MTRRRKLTALWCWLPVVGLVVALFAVPSSNGAAAPRLDVDPPPGSGQYGGTSVTWSGNIGSRGEQKIWLERRGSTAGIWSEVIHPGTGRLAAFKTRADGSFSFKFPAPAMNAVYFRVAARGGATPGVQFLARHQDADVMVEETRPAKQPGVRGVIEPLPRGFAVVGEPYAIEADTTRGADNKLTRVLQGRGVELQLRDAGNEWDALRSGRVGNDGFVRFAQQGAESEDGVYRVLLQDWTQDGDNIGWFPSLPFYLDVVDRPLPVEALSATTTTSSVALSWRLPPDPNRAKIVITRSSGGEEPTWAKPRLVVAAIAGSATSYTDRNGIVANRSYRYAIYTVSEDGVYSREATRDTFQTPAERSAP